MDRDRHFEVMIDLIALRWAGNQCARSCNQMGRRYSEGCGCPYYYQDPNKNSPCNVCKVKLKKTRTFSFPVFVWLDGLIWSVCGRLCSDGDAVHICYTTDNSRVYHKEELQSFEIQTEVISFFLIWNFLLHFSYVIDLTSIFLYISLSTQMP